MGGILTPIASTGGIKRIMPNHNWTGNSQGDLKRGTLMSLIALIRMILVAFIGATKPAQGIIMLNMASFTSQPPVAWFRIKDL